MDSNEIKSVHLTLRLPESLVKNIERVRKKLEARAMVKISRNQAIEHILQQGITESLIS